MKTKNDTKLPTSYIIKMFLMFFDFCLLVNMINLSAYFIIAK
jgi:hypothetical protein